MSTKRTLSFVALATLCACGSDDLLASSDPHQPYSDGATTVIGGDPAMPVASGQVGEDGCLQITTDTCVAVAREGKYCKTDDGPVDAVVVDGKVVDVVCYEDTDGAQGPSVIVDGNHDGNIDVPQQDNGAVITFDPSTDGKPIKGDVVVDGNNVTLYGNGPDKSIIDGNLTITGNNARVRGVHVTGNVHIDLNTAALVFCVVDGNLKVDSNNSLIAECKVAGDFEVKGNNCILVNNTAGKEWKIDGSNTTCDGNTKFPDGSALSCALAP